MDHTLRLHASYNRATALLEERGSCLCLNMTEVRWRSVLGKAQILHVSIFHSRKGVQLTARLKTGSYAKN